MKALILGGCGFIGSHIVDALLAAGANVRVFDRQKERYRPNLPKVDYIFGQFNDKALIAEALTDVDTVFHLITTTFPGTADLNPVADVNDNLIATLELINLMKALEIRRMIYLSSGGTVYGVPQVIPIPENHPLLPQGSYGIVKAAIEFYLCMYMERNVLDPVIVRASNPYGPRQGHAGVQGVVATFLNRVVNNEPIEIWGDGLVVRDYIHVRELADLCVKAALSQFKGPLNAGSGIGTSVNDIVAAISRNLGVTLSPKYLPGRPVDVPINVLDITLAKKSFPWAPEISMDQGLEETWNWLKNENSQK